MKKYVDMGMRYVEFSVGDQVLLKLTPQIWKKITSKFVHCGLISKYGGPARSKQELLDEAKDSLAKAQCRMKKYVDMGMQYVEFSVGDQVLLKLTSQIWKKITSKFVHRGLISKYSGPFEVMGKVGLLAYRLKLPNRLKIHPTFHVSFLKKFQQDLLDTARQQTQRAPPVIRKEFEKTVLKILDHRTIGQSMCITALDGVGMVRHSDGQLGRRSVELPDCGVRRQACCICRVGRLSNRAHWIRQLGATLGSWALELGGSAQNLLSRAVTLERLMSGS
ncbi:UNVERIFIED_CONTAM: hypothetical protein Sradi_4863200 [Sesamum radiatum]|uniref:Tf2-1-like SH3-like domain-containing protein n=1 Tax=Sesamum radiatum TaxID=300843 RepID=A0AAW2N022_SESRA